MVMRSRENSLSKTAERVYRQAEQDLRVHAGPLYWHYQVRVHDAARIKDLREHNAAVDRLLDDYFRFIAPAERRYDQALDEMPEWRDVRKAAKRDALRASRTQDRGAR